VEYASHSTCIASPEAYLSFYRYESDDTDQKKAHDEINMPHDKMFSAENIKLSADNIILAADNMLSYKIMLPADKMCQIFCF
jgi:hypothetical protein